MGEAKTFRLPLGLSFSFCGALLFLSHFIKKRSTLSYHEKKTVLREVRDRYEPE